MDPVDSSCYGEKYYSSPLSGFYFDKANGVMLTTAYIDSSVHQAFFCQLQNNINTALEPLIECLTTQVSLSPDIENCLDFLINNLNGKKPFLRTEKNKSGYSVSQLANALSIVTSANENDCRELLLQINACKSQYVYTDPWMVLENKKILKPGFSVVESFAQFQEMVEEKISELTSNHLLNFSSAF